MNPFLFALLIAAVAGITMAIQGSLNAVLGRVVGLLEATLIIHVVGTIVALTALLTIRFGSGGLSLFKEAPWFTYLGGALGVLIVIGVAFSLPRAGVANATTAIIIGQVATAMLIDQLGFFGLEKIPITWWNAFGLALLAGGGYCMLCR
ncbi:MAG: DMT family transporter [Bacillota bacterium]